MKSEERRMKQDNKDKDIEKDGKTDKAATKGAMASESAAAKEDAAAKKDAAAQKAPDGPQERLSLKEVIKEQATEDEAPQSRYFSLRKILGGDILNTNAVRRQVWLFLLIGFFIVLYIANRYSCQKDIIEIDRLEGELIDAKYKALSSNSKLTEKSRQSNVLELLRANNDSTLKLPTQPPYIITVPE